MSLGNGQTHPVAQSSQEDCRCVCAPNANISSHSRGVTTIGTGENFLAETLKDLGS
jgi:hypothetical protein